MITLPFDARRVGQPPPVADGDGLLPHVERGVVVLEQPSGVVLSAGHLEQDLDNVQLYELDTPTNLISTLHLYTTKDRMVDNGEQESSTGCEGEAYRPPTLPALTRSLLNNAVAARPRQRNRARV